MTRFYAGHVVSWSRVVVAGLLLSAIVACHDEPTVSQPSSGLSVNADATNGTSVGGPNCVPPASGLVSWWRAEGDATDVTGGNDGAPQNGATFAPGEVRQAFLLDGINDYVEAGNAANLHVSSGEFTVEAWERFNTLSSDWGGDQSILDKMAGPTNADGWRLLK